TGWSGSTTTSGAGTISPCSYAAPCWRWASDSEKGSQLASRAEGTIHPDAAHVLAEGEPALHPRRHVEGASRREGELSWPGRTTHRRSPGGAEPDGWRSSSGWPRS